MAKPISPDQLLREYAEGKLDFEPGTRWSYSNTGYVILGLVVEKVAGEPFGRFLERRILRPLAMDHTSYDPEGRSQGLAQGYASFALGPPEMANPEGRGWVAAAGALWSTPSDLAKWDLALLDGKLLKSESFKLMTTPRVLTNGRVTEYGCGLAISLRNGVTVLTHSGMVSGFNAHNSMIPSARSAVVLLSNSEFLIGSLHSNILSLMTKPREDLPKIAGVPALDAARLFLTRLQSGNIDRQQLGEEFNYLQTAERLLATSTRLKALGEPTEVDVDQLSERGGMEVANVRFAFKSGSAVKALMYRTPDGKIQEFLVLRE
jgi:CubicO group peptidase (beta-lactamase class C family)